MDSIEGKKKGRGVPRKPKTEVKIQQKRRGLQQHWVKTKTTQTDQQVGGGGREERSRRQAKHFHGPRIKKTWSDGRACNFEHKGERDGVWIVVRRCGGRRGIEEAGAVGGGCLDGGGGRGG